MNLYKFTNNGNTTFNKRYITVTTFIIYLIEKKNEYGKKFDLITFLVGNEKCRNN